MKKYAKMKYSFSKIALRTQYVTNLTNILIMT